MPVFVEIARRPRWGIIGNPRVKGKLDDASDDDFITWRRQG